MRDQIIDTNLSPESALVAQGWPPALAKATIDEFTYAVGLKTGLVIVFTTAVDLENGFVRLEDVHYRRWPGEFSGYVINGFMNEFSFDRGIEVRLSEIVWVCDAPFGS